MSQGFPISSSLLFSPGRTGKVREGVVITAQHFREWVTTELRGESCQHLPWPLSWDLQGPCANQEMIPLVLGDAAGSPPSLDPMGDIRDIEHSSLFLFSSFFEQDRHKVTSTDLISDF